MYLYQELTEKIIGVAIAMHRELGPGFLESIYEEAFSMELRRQKIYFERQVPVNIGYRDRVIGSHRLDLIIEHKVVVELKAIKEIEDVHVAIALSYLKAADLKIALILNFARATVGVRRVARGVRFFNTEAQSFRDAEKIFPIVQKKSAMHNLSTNSEHLSQGCDDYDHKGDVPS